MIDTQKAEEMIMGFDSKAASRFKRRAWVRGNTYRTRVFSRYAEMYRRKLENQLLAISRMVWV